MGWHQFTSQLPEALEFQFSFSPTGWSCRELGIAWVTGLFDLQMQETLKPRLLIIDGHNSQAHVSIQFFNSVLLTTLSFTVYHHYYGKEGDLLVRRKNQGIKKANFLPLYIKARKPAYTQNKIQQASLTAGIVPPKPHIILLGLTSTTVKLTTANILPSEISLFTPRDSGALQKAGIGHQ